MKNRNLAISIFTLVAVVILISSTTIEVLATASTNLETKKFAEKTNLPPRKVLAVTFNQPVNSLTLDKNISVVDSKGNSVPVSFMKDIFNKNIVRISPPTGGYKEGESYTLKLNKGIATIKDNHLKYDVLMNFSIKAKKSDNKPIEIDKTNRDDMKTILKDYTGGKTFNNKFTNMIYLDDFYNEYKKNPAKYKQEVIKYMNTPLYKGMPNNVKDWYLDADNKSGEYAQIRHNFNKKYLNDKYADITDIDYFTRMKTNLDFSQVNNDDFVPEGCYGKIKYRILNIKY